jgi:hypothetical protein
MKCKVRYPIGEDPLSSKEGQCFQKDKFTLANVNEDNVLTMQAIVCSDDDYGLINRCRSLDN